MKEHIWEIGYSDISGRDEYVCQVCQLKIRVSFSGSVHKTVKHHRLEDCDESLVKRVHDE